MIGLKFEQEHPCILPANATFSELIVKKCLHSGLQDTLDQVREWFWIIKGRQLTKRVVHTWSAVNIKLLRLSRFQPYYLNSALRKRLHLKSQEWTLLALCTINLKTSCSPQRFSSRISDWYDYWKVPAGVHSFVSRRRLCKTIYSGNAKTFKWAHKELKALWDPWIQSLQT